MTVKKIKLEQLQDEPPETPYELTVFGMRTKQKKFKKGIAWSKCLK